MALGILTDEELELELEKEKKKQGIIKDMPALGRGNKQEVPESTRKVVAELAINGTDPSIIAREFGISKSSISAYKHDATSTASYNEPDTELKKHNNEVRNKIVTRARRKLHLALNNLTPDKLEDCKARDLSGIAKDMAAVIKQMEPDSDKGVNNNNQFIFLVPPMVTEERYDIIDVQD